MKVNWIIDEYLLDNNPRYGKIVGHIRDLGHNSYTTKYIPFSDEQDYGNFTKEDCVVLYGTVGFINRCKIPFVPGAYIPSYEESLYSHYTQHIPANYMLNDDYIMTTWGDLLYNPGKYQEIFNSRDVFIRPNSGRKTFAGFKADLEDIEYLTGTQKTSSVENDTIIVVASPKEILGEFRFVICDNEVIAGSEYRWDNILDVREDYDMSCLSMAKEVSRLEQQFDSVYTCDVALTNDGPRIVELNSFSCAGLYACDLKTVVDRVSQKAIRDWKEVYE